MIKAKFKDTNMDNETDDKFKMRNRHGMYEEGAVKNLQMVAKNG